MLRASLICLLYLLPYECESVGFGHVMLSEAKHLIAGLVVMVRLDASLHSA